MVTEGGEGQLKAIDNGFAFLFRHPTYHGTSAPQLSANWWGSTRKQPKLSDETITKFKRLGDPDVRSSLRKTFKQFKTIPTDHIDKFFARVDYMLPKLDDGSWKGRAIGESH